MSHGGVGEDDAATQLSVVFCPREAAESFSGSSHERRRKDDRRNALCLVSGVPPDAAWLK